MVGTVLFASHNFQLFDTKLLLRGGKGVVYDGSRVFFWFVSIIESI